MSNKLKLLFGTPEHGWLPLTLEYGNFKLELDVSDVPMDPMRQLCDALIQLLKGIKTPDKVMLHLEPYCYYLQLLMVDKGYQVVVSESEYWESPAQQAQVITGDFQTIILPLYRALKQFWAKAYQHPHWEELDSERISLLTDLIKDKKNTSRPKKL